MSIPIITQRMLILKDWLKSVGEIRSDREFFRIINASEGSITRVKKGERQFTSIQVAKAVTLWESKNKSLANPYYLFNIPHPKYNQLTPKTPTKKKSALK